MASAIASRRLEKSGPRTSGSLHRALVLNLAAMVAIETRDRVEVDDFASSADAARDEPSFSLHDLAPAHLTSRIILFNFVGLVILVGILYFSQSRESLISARVQSLMTQGHIMAAAIASSATVDTGEIVIDPDKLLEPSEEAGDVDVHNLDFLINPERAGPVLRRLVLDRPGLGRHPRPHLRPRGRRRRQPLSLWPRRCAARRAAAHRQESKGC